MKAMVDGTLPLERKERPLQYLFLDLNAYFASVEQQERPELRGRPVAVVPVDADTSFVIAASYEAKAIGIKTGTMIREAKEKCPELQIVMGRAPVYMAYHQRVLKVVESVLPIDQVCSIDEMRFRLLGTERTPKVAEEIAVEMKRAIRDGVGQQMSCSVGIAPNAFLAKVGTEIQKPDGLVTIEAHDLPDKLHSLRLTDFPGINKRMAARLNAAGIFSSQQLCAASRSELLRAFGSIVGERWWYMLRGFDLGIDVHDRKTMGHSHVLAPDLRTEKGAWEVLLRLLTKASARLRSTDLWATAMAVYVKGYRKSWKAHVRMPATQDTVTMNEHLSELWETHDFDVPHMVAVTFYELRTEAEFTPSLFTPTKDRSELSHAVDKVNQRFGKNSVFLAGMENVRHTAEEKIAFNKTWLFSEGRGDNEWTDAFQGMPLTGRNALPTSDEQMVYAPNGDDDFPP
jgi:DNA polymerase-4